MQTPKKASIINESIISAVEGYRGQHVTEDYSSIE